MMKVIFGLTAFLLLVVGSSGRLPDPLGLPVLTPSGELQQVCNTSDYTYSTDALPIFPNQFSVLIEANILNEQRTTWIHELYDDVNNRGRLTFHRNGTRERGIFDYDNDEIFVFPDIDSGNECTVSRISQSQVTNFTFGLTRVNGSIHIGSARDFLIRFSDSTTARGPFPDDVRGVPAVRYQVCTSGENISFVSDYYYTTADWTYGTLSSPSEFDIPLSQIVVRGNSLLRGDPHSFHHVYSVLGLETGPESVPDRAFAVPTGLACVGRIAGKPLPELPNFFSTYVQIVNSADNDGVATAREYYDFNHKLVRFDYYDDGQSGVNDIAGPYQTIQDFGGQVAYTINRHTSSCVVSTLADGPVTTDFNYDDNNNARLNSPSRLFLLGNRFNYSYEGVSTVRGVQVDSWVSIRDFEVLNNDANLTNGVYEIFFTRPGYNVTTDRSAGAEVVPWRLTIRGEIVYFPNATADPNQTNSTDVLLTIDFFDFSSSEPPYDVYDVSLCSSGNQSHTVILAFPVPVVRIDFGSLRTNLRAAIVNATNLQPLQVNNIQFLVDRGDHIVVSVFLTDLPDLARVSTVVTSKEAHDIFESLTGFGEAFPFTVDVGDGLKVAPILVDTRRGGSDSNCSTPTVVLNNTCPITAPTCPPTATPPKTKTVSTLKTTTAPSCTDNITSRLTDGVIAGIAIGLFFAGIILALLLLLIGWCCVKFMRGGDTSGGSASAVKYKKHDNEVESIS